MDITIYTSTGCGYCSKIKELMKRMDLDYTEQRLGVDFSREDFQAMFPTESGFPRLVIDGELIGGLTDAVKYFVDKGMLSSGMKK